jgi:hypothetical protein
MRREERVERRGGRGVGEKWRGKQKERGIRAAACTGDFGKKLTRIRLTLGTGKVKPCGGPLVGEHTGPSGKPCVRVASFYRTEASGTSG